MANDQPNDTFIQSREPANNGYGQNGFQGPSSDLPGKKTTSGFLPQSTKPADDWQTRAVDASPIAAHPGMSPRKDGGTVPPNGRPVTRKI